MGSLSIIDAPLKYPKARRDESLVDYYHGTPVSDPYRWLEDPDSEETKEFVKSQVELTESLLKPCVIREKIKGRLKEVFEFERFQVPFKRGDKYFFFHNKGLQPQDVLYVQDSLDGEPRVLLDPNELSKDGTASLHICAVSENAQYLAYGLSTCGSDWITIKVMSVADQASLPDTIRWVKFSGLAWTHDNKGFFYSRYPAPKGECTGCGTETNINLNHELYYHVLGTDQSEDILCWKDLEHPRYRFYPRVTDDGKYLLLQIEENCEEVNKLYYLNLSSLLHDGLRSAQDANGLLPFTRLVDDLDALYHYVANDDTKFTFKTNKNAPRCKLVCVDLNEPDVWIDVLPESEKDVLVSTEVANKTQLIVCYLRDVKHVLEIRDLQTGAFLHHLPIDIGTVRISARRNDSTVFISFTSFLTFNITYHCDLATEVPEMKIFREISVPNFDRADYKIDQIFVPSKDGTKIPMFVVARKDVVLDKSNPCLLYAYGGFNVSVTPGFSVIRTVLLKHLGAIFCIANVRGGGEYGEEWHREGTLERKQNCFDDFISAAEFLVSNGYTQPSKLCIEGRSNGGLLIGACINQRPDLFGCALAHVGVMDMLRFHKFTIGHAWTADFGCSEKEEEFNSLIKYSPLHNVRRPWENSSGRYIQYPATMLLTADHDDRVVPLHSLKLLATMQYTLCTSLTRSPQINPIVGRIECKAGHGCGRPIHKEIDEAADRYSFMAKMVDASWNDY
ncbi:prolyl endopeptidase-like [Chenopodium quinoa]|uniref:Prolyl endopeptidase n=1 Tax=Chenopodium quinoa TaxID=63459 RepID=A0A803LIP4_CHEQI|nr:prolyl endopeptidase-like [Chenopodium quinoa]